MSGRPPKRRCPGCGGDHYAWQEGTLCRRCRTDGAGDRAELAGMVRDARLARRARLDALREPKP